MANAQVEKIKSLALRHGEKAFVAAAAAACVVFLFFAATKPSIEITPDQVSKDAEAARSSLETRQEPADILTSLEEQGIKNPGFAMLVEAQEKDAPKPSDYKLARTWVSPEPGAGMIRDKPDLIAPTNLYAYPGRGGASLFEVVDGKRVPEDPAEKKDEDAATKTRRGRKKRRGPSMMGSSSGSAMAMMSSGSGMTTGATNPAEMTEAQKKQFAIDEKKRKALLAGTAKNEIEKPDDQTSTPEGPFKEITRGLRWVAITGTLDHKKLRDNYLTALKNPVVAHPNYKQLDVERQVKQNDGTWSDWERVDAEKNHEITYNIPEEEEELTPDTVRIAALCDPLPFLKAGYWERVHVASLVPKEKRDIEKPAGSSSMMGSSSSAMMSSSMMGGSMSPSSMMSSPMMGSSMMGSSSMMGGGMGSSEMMMGGSAETTKFATTDAPTIMIRSLDFTVDPDTTYRFRTRIVVFNPNYNREDVSPGTDTKKLELLGPWSEPTNEVTMPADITAYAIKKANAPPNAKRSDLVSFQIVKWNPEDGVTVTRNRDYGPGQIVGEPISTPVPVPDGSGAKPKMIDYNSHQVLLDESGGDESLNPLGINGKLDVPVVSLLVRPDGSVMVRNEAYDLADPVRKDMVENYNREVKESSERRENSTGMSSSSSMMMMMGSGR